jgi:ankyrin repeat protein
MKITDEGCIKVSLVNEFFESVKAKDATKVKELLDRDANLVHSKTENGDSAVIIAVYYGAHEVLEILLTQEPELNIFEAAALGNADKIKEIVTTDPGQVNSFSHDGWTALHLASFFGHPEAADLLVKNNAFINPRTKNSMNNLPIHAAAASRKIEIVEMLLNQGADVNEKQQGGFTPLHEAAITGNLEMVQLCLKHSVDKNIKNDKGETALTLASSKEHHHVVEFLQNYTENK